MFLKQSYKLVHYRKNFHIASSSRFLFYSSLNRSKIFQALQYADEIEDKVEEKKVSVYEQSEAKDSKYGEIMDFRWIVGAKKQLIPYAVLKNSVLLDGKEYQEVPVGSLYNLLRNQFNVGDRIECVLGDKVGIRQAEDEKLEYMFELPQNCPCQKDHLLVKDGNTLYCGNEDCPETLIPRILHACSVSSLNIPSVNADFLSKLVEHEFIHTFSDFFTIPDNQIHILKALPELDAKFRKVRDDMNAALEYIPLDRMLYALGLAPKPQCTLMAQLYTNINEIQQLDLGKLKRDCKFSHQQAISVIEDLQYFRKDIERLKHLGIFGDIQEHEKSKDEDEVSDTNKSNQSNHRKLRLVKWKPERDPTGFFFAECNPGIRSQYRNGKFTISPGQIEITPPEDWVPEMKHFDDIGANGFLLSSLSKTKLMQLLKSKQWTSDIIFSIYDTDQHDIPTTDRFQTLQELEISNPQLQLVTYGNISSPSHLMELITSSNSQAILLRNPKNAEIVYIQSTKTS